MRDHNDLPYIVIERQSAGLAPFVWGALVGAGVALLLAPRSGEEMQEDIRQGVRRIRTSAEEKVGAARATVVRTRDRVEDRIDSVRDRLDEQTDRAREAVDSGRRAARGAREEIERRLADVREPQVAADRAGEDTLSATAPFESDVPPLDRAGESPDLG